MNGMKTHGNSRKNEKDHHLYVIYDKEENDIFKYGISEKPIGKDGYSSRMRRQVDFVNSAVGWLRYFAEILLRGIAGRAKARKIEDEHIDAYRLKHGRNPRGNREKKQTCLKGEAIAVGIHLGGGVDGYFWGATRFLKRGFKKLSSSTYEN